MSLDLSNQEQLFTADKILKDFLSDEHPMMIFSKEIYSQFRDEDFIDYYSDIGRNGLSPAFLSRVTLLQFRENQSDSEAQESCSNRIDWKIALHLELEKKIDFDPSTLCRFRKRLKENYALSIIFDKIVDFAIKKKFIKKKTNQRIDATHIIAHVNRISTTDLLFRTVKCLVEEIEKLNIDFYENEVPEEIKERYAKKFSSFGMSKSTRMDKQADIVEDGLYLKNRLSELCAEEIENYRQLKIMETIFEENVIIKKKEINDKEFIEIQEIESPKQTIFDPRDTDIQMGIKGKKSWVGSKCHILETAEMGEVNFITDMIYQRANENDNKILDKIEDSNKRTGIKSADLFGDGNYISGGKIKEFEEKGKKLMGHFQGESRVKPKGFLLSDFKIDTKRQKAICPANHKTLSFTENKDDTISIRFERSICVQCKYFELCVGKSKAKKRILTITKHHDYIQKRRKEQKTAKFKNAMKVRAQVEGTISEAVRFHGLRYKKYKGVLGDELQYYMTGAAINLKRLIKSIQKTIN